MTEAAQAASRPLGLVPTMGYLHDGHLALVRRGRAENATLVASIFVNPAQFGPREDFSTYPRDMASDLARLEHEGVDIVFAPSEDEMYPAGFDTWVTVGALADRLEGRSRPDHFRGVATVVCKLLTIVRPDRAYFGQKDIQQTVVVTRMVADLNLGAAVVVVPTVREPDGLALSSRNAYLSPEERRSATVLYRALELARRMRDDGISDAAPIKGRDGEANCVRAARDRRLRQHRCPGIPYRAGENRRPRRGLPRRPHRQDQADRQPAPSIAATTIK